MMKLFYGLIRWLNGLMDSPAKSGIKTQPLPFEPSMPVLPEPPTHKPRERSVDRMRQDNDWKVI